MPWYVVIGSGAWKSHKVEADTHVRHRKGVSFYLDEALVAEYAGDRVFRVMWCSTETEANAAIERIYASHRGTPRDVASQLEARKTSRRAGPDSPQTPV